MKSVIIIMLVLMMKMVLSYQHGQYKSYYESGAVEKEGMFKYGSACGAHFTYFENGKVKESIQNEKCDEIGQPRQNPWRLPNY